MKLTPQRLAAIMNEWARRFADHPDEFDAILGPDGRPIEDYGDRCVAYIQKLDTELKT